MNNTLGYLNAKTKFENALSSFSMLKGHKSVLVGFSGGADSTLLLTLLSEMQGLNVGACHLNHSIRGEEAERDERFCCEFCQRMNIPFFSKKIDIPKLSKETGMGIEETARNARYEFFNEVAKKQGYELIATAHNSDDNLETVLFRLTRGTSPDGLCGIPPIRDKIIRPLIFLSKKEIISALDDKNIYYVTDSTNQNNDYTRNYIRNVIVPSLKTINPSINDSVNSLSELLRTDKEYFNSETSLYSFKSGRKTLSVLHNSILSRVITSELSMYDCDVNRKHVDALITAIRSNSQHLSLDLNGLTVCVDRDLIFISEQLSASEFSFQIHEGLNIINAETALLLLKDDSSSEENINKFKNIYKFSIQETISSAKINESTVIRSRKQGDTYRTNGMTKKVKKLIQSLKLPKQTTDSFPFIETDGDIVYMPFFKPEQDNDRYTDNYRVVYLSSSSSFETT